jgi:hypothetical protein
MAERVGDHPGVLGLELINEPGWGTAPDIDELEAPPSCPSTPRGRRPPARLVGDDLLILFTTTPASTPSASPPSSTSARTARA